MDDRAIGLIGLMRRAGAIEIGEDNSGSAVSAGKAKLLLTAADASENALRHAERFTQGRRVITVPLHYTRDELGKALGIGGCSMAAVTDIGFANALMKELSEQKDNVNNEKMKEPNKAKTVNCNETCNETCNCHKREKSNKDINKNRSRTYTVINVPTQDEIERAIRALFGSDLI